MKRNILMASAAMLISLAAFAGNGKQTKSCCTGGTCAKACSSKCVCDTKKCTPATCTSKTCACHK